MGGLNPRRLPLADTALIIDFGIGEFHKVIYKSLGGLRELKLFDCLRTQLFSEVFILQQPKEFLSEVSV